MPVYKFECSECSHQFEQFRTIAQYDIPLKEACPFCYKIGYISRLIYTLGFVDSHKLESTPGRTKPPREFNNLLKDIKKKNKGSTFEVHE